MISFVGRIDAPASKSSSLRAIICAILSNNKPVTINNVSLCDDVLSAITLFTSIGYKIDLSKNTLRVISFTPNKCKELYCGESGFLARIMVSLASLYSNEYTISGEKTLLSRNLDITPFCHALGYSSSSDYLPTTIKSKQLPDILDIDASQSSQLLSGLLFLLANLNQTRTINIHNLVSKPYLLLSLDYLHKAKIKYVFDEHEMKITIPGNQEYKVFELTPESDWSSMSYIIALGLLNGDIEINNIQDNKAAPDRVIVDILKEAGGNIELKANSIHVSSSKLNNINFDLTHNPDLAPILSALAISCKNQSVLTGCKRLFSKESNRLKSIIEMFKTLNVSYCLSDDDNTLTIYPTIIEGGLVETFNDHRIAMSALVLNSISKNKIDINNYQCINKSFPEFIDIYNRLGLANE